MDFKNLFFIVFFVLLADICLAQDSMNIDMTLSKNDIVKESIQIIFDARESYDSVEFTTVLKPVTISYNGDYSIQDEGDGYVITFEKDIKQGKNILNFVLVYDNILEGDANSKVFRTRFYPENTELMHISLTLPTYYILSDKEPSVTPKPDSITTDGQRIKLGWVFDEQADLVVFYKSQSSNHVWVYLLGAAVFAISALSYIYFKKKARSDISDILSGEEKKVVGEIRKGVTKQKDIAANLDFSKSKMSKVIRKLEEKELIEKKPYFKTNIIRLSAKIK
jgi:uncharacterized membrane protein